jgi:hypothetical protein
MSNWRERMQKNKESEEIKKNLERIKKYEVNDLTFPSLAMGDVWASPAPPAGGAGAPRTMPLSDDQRSFATLAKNWSEKEETDRLEKERLAREAAEQKRTGESSRHHFFNHSIFGASRSRDDDTYYEDDYGTLYPQGEPVADDGWRTQERKVRRRREDRPLYDTAINEDLNTWEQAPPEDY